MFNPSSSSSSMFNRPISPLILKNNSTLTNMMSPNQLVKYYSEKGSKKPFTDAIKAFEVSEVLKKEQFSPKKMSVEELYNHYKNTGSTNATIDTLNIIKPKEENNKLIDHIPPYKSNNLKDDMSFEQNNPMISSLNERNKPVKGKKFEQLIDKLLDRNKNIKLKDAKNIGYHSIYDSERYKKLKEDEIKRKEEQQKIADEINIRGVNNILKRGRGRPKKEKEQEN
jgi:hypothetical protein